MSIHNRLTAPDACHPLMFIGSTDPSTVPANDVQPFCWWRDTTGGTTLLTGALLKERNAGNTAWVTILDLTTLIATLAPLASPALSGNPTAPTQSAGDNSTKLATTAYVKAAADAAIAGLSWKQEVRAATTAAGTLASSFANGQTIDGVTLATGDRLLIKNQAAPAENGIYIVAASGAPARATDADAGAELVNATCYVSEGTANADSAWTCTTNAPITPGSTALTFVQFGAGATYSADESTLHLSGTTFSVKSSAPLPGSPTTTTQSPSDNSSKLATTAYVDAAIIAGVGGVPAFELFDDTTKSADYTVVAPTDKGKTFICTAPLTLTLPSATNKFQFGVYNASSSGYVIVGSLICLMPDEWCRIASDGSSFYVIDARLRTPTGSIDRITAVPNAADDHFIGSSVDTGGTRFASANAWTAQNLGTSTVSVADSALQINPQAVSSNTIRGYEQSLPGGAWKRRAKVALTAIAGFTEMGSGLWIRNSANSRVIYCGITNNAGGFIPKVLFFDDVNTFDTTLAAVNGVENLLSQWIYFEIAYDGGTALTYSYSFNGLPGTYVLAFTGSTSTLGAAATHVGIGGEVKNASASATLFLADWFKAG